jgi:S-adenosylmethionine synthetase
VRLVVDAIPGPAADEQAVEVVERKGKGHPDTICDALAEELSLGLSRFYRERFGAILHHNVDKVLLWGGRSEPAFGGGRVLAPIEVFLAGRAAAEHRGVRVPIEEIAREGSRRWLAAHLRYLDVEAHVRLHALVRPGSVELVELFARGSGAVARANDTSIGVGYAPLSRLESLVHAIEEAMRSDVVRSSHPELGDDVKVMAVRAGECIELTVACAFVDRHLRDVGDYVARKEGLAALVLELARSRSGREVAVRVNPADEPSRGSVYLTVTGTSAESGDDGEAGRGNRANGLITPGRPMTLESVAGKNPVSHVGKLYNLAAGLLAEALVAALPGVVEAHGLLVSRIGAPIDEPQLVEVRLRDGRGRAPEALAPRVEEVVRAELARLPVLADELLAGRLAADRWPLRR